MPDVEDVLDKLVDEPAPKGAETEPNEPNKKTIVFDELDDDVKRFIDQQRTQASKTAREKALRDAVKDPDIQKAIRAQLEEEAKLSAEERVAQKERAIAERENRIEAREKLVDAGITGEDLTKVLQFVVSDSKESTLEKTQAFIDTFTAMVESATTAKTRELIKGTPKPKTNATVTKEFKDMDSNEREALKKADPARFKAEVEKNSKRI